MEKCKVNRYGDVVTIDVERKYATELADYLVGMNCDVTEVRLQHETNTGKILIKLSELVDEDLIISFCKLYFMKKNDETNNGNT